MVFHTPPKKQKTSVNPCDKPRDSATATSHEKGQIPHLGLESNPVI
jgi:hypothetical protein